jgi:hypothetical protein
MDSPVADLLYDSKPPLPIPGLSLVLLAENVIWLAGNAPHRPTH